MHVSVETTGTLARRMTVAVPADRLEQEVADRLKRLSKQVRVPGFRPGKVPMKMVEAQYASRVMDEVAVDLMRQTFQEAIGQQGLKPAGGPRIQPKTVTRGKVLEYVAEFEVYPEIGEIRLGDTKIERPVCAVTDADVDRTLETMRKQRRGWQAVERAAQEGDQVTIDFKGTVAGQPISGGEAEDFPLVLGSKSLIEGFESGLVGARAGEARTLEVTFPADYRNEELAGKPASFAVTVKAVAEPVLPALDEEFARQFGIADGSLETLRREVRANLEREAASRQRAAVRGQVVNALLAANRFELPQAMLDAEIERLQRMDAAGGEPSPESRPMYAEMARRRVSLALILSEYVRTQSITADPAAVRRRIEEMAVEYENPEEFLRWYLSDASRIADAESMVMEDIAIERLSQQARMEDKPATFQELLQRDTRA